MYISPSKFLLLQTTLLIILSQVVQNVITKSLSSSNKTLIYHQFSFSNSSLTTTTSFPPYYPIDPDTDPFAILQTVAYILLGAFIFGFISFCLCIYCCCCRRPLRTKGQVLQRNVNIQIERNNYGISEDYQQQHQPPTPPPEYTVVDNHYQQHQNQQHQQPQLQQQNYHPQRDFEREDMFRPGPSQIAVNDAENSNCQTQEGEFSSSRVLSSKVRLI